MDFDHNDVKLFQMGMMGTLKTKGAPLFSIEQYVNMMNNKPWFTPAGFHNGLLKGQINLFAAGRKTGKTLLNEQYGYNKRISTTQDTISDGNDQHTKKSGSI